MEGISDLKISGMDETRPPVLNKAPYIDLFFKLNHKAPKDWCTDFNLLSAKDKFPAKIAPDTGLFIETWVRKPEEISAVLEGLKLTINTCIDAYIAKINAASAAANISGGTPKADGPQSELNSVIAGLQFDDDTDL